MLCPVHSSPAGWPGDDCDRVPCEEDELWRVLGEVQFGHGDKQHLLQQVVQPHALQDLDHLKGGGDGGVWEMAIICLIFGEQTILSIFEHLSLFQIIRT